MRIYRAVAEHIDTFNRFFNERLLPVQLRHGARLVGRWQTEDDRIVAVWEYDDRDAYQQVQALVRQDPDSIEAQRYRHEILPQLISDAEEVFMTSTLFGD